jgi:hypothetical protein
MENVITAASSVLHCCMNLFNLSRPEMIDLLLYVSKGTDRSLEAERKTEFVGISCIIGLKASNNRMGNSEFPPRWFAASKGL